MNRTARTSSRTSRLLPPPRRRHAAAVLLPLLAACTSREQSGDVAQAALGRVVPSAQTKAATGPSAQTKAEAGPSAQTSSLDVCQPLIEDPTGTILQPSSNPTSLDTNGVDQPNVVFVANSSTYHLWFRATDSAGTQRIMHTTSTDARSWNSESTLALDVGVEGSWDAKKLGNPSVIYDPSPAARARFMMWYHGYDKDNIIRIGLATSADGIAWTKHSANPVLSAGAPGEWDAQYVGNPTVVKVGSVYRMYYSASDAAGKYATYHRIGLAESTDGASWTRYSGNPVLGGDYWREIFARVKYFGGTYYMWYSVDNDDNQYDYTYQVAAAKSSDGINWTKCAEPVLKTEDIGSNPHMAYGADVLIREDPEGTGLPTVSMYFSFSGNGTAPFYPYAIAYARTPPTDAGSDGDCFPDNEGFFIPDAYAQGLTVASDGGVSGTMYVYFLDDPTPIDRSADVDAIRSAIFEAWNGATGYYCGRNVTIDLAGVNVVQRLSLTGDDDGVHLYVYEHIAAGEVCASEAYANYEDFQYWLDLYNMPQSSPMYENGEENGTMFGNFGLFLYDPTNHDDGPLSWRAMAAHGFGHFLGLNDTYHNFRHTDEGGDTCDFECGTEDGTGLMGLSSETSEYSVKPEYVTAMVEYTNGCYLTMDRTATFERISEQCDHGEWLNGTYYSDPDAVRTHCIDSTDWMRFENDVYTYAPEVTFFSTYGCPDDGDPVGVDLGRSVADAVPVYNWASLSGSVYEPYAMYSSSDSYEPRFVRDGERYIFEFQQASASITAEGEGVRLVSVPGESSYVCAPSDQTTQVVSTFTLSNFQSMTSEGSVVADGSARYTYFYEEEQAGGVCSAQPEGGCYVNSESAVANRVQDTLEWRAHVGYAEVVNP